MTISDYIILAIVISLLASLATMASIGAWMMFEDTELWEILKDKMTEKKK